MDYQVKVNLQQIGLNEKSDLPLDEIETLCNNTVELAGIPKDEIFENAVSWFAGSSNSTNFLALKGAMLLMQLAD